MTAYHLSDQRMTTALQELRQTIESHYPTATFDVTEGLDPEGVYLWATVDIDDTDEVVDLIIDRVLDLQIENDLPVFVIPVRPVERVLATFGTAPGRRYKSLSLLEA